MDFQSLTYDKTAPSSKPWANDLFNTVAIPEAPTRTQAIPKAELGLRPALPVLPLKLSLSDRYHSERKTGVVGRAAQVRSV